MPTNFKFSASTDLVGIRTCGSSIGAHLAAKLEAFGSDERTLTDELCDMLCIWLKSSSAQQPVIRIQLGKTTPNEEALNGADLRLIIRTPDGVKDCLFQAKVLDPYTGKLRYASSAGFAKLKSQLQKAQSTCGDLAFLLVYVPSQHLDGAQHGYGTYEQGFCRKKKAGFTSALGATVIPVNLLLTRAGDWINPSNPIPHSGGLFTNGLPFWRVFLELLVCLRGVWQHHEPNQPQVNEDRTESFVQLLVNAESNVPWLQLKDLAADVLDSET